MNPFAARIYAFALLPVAVAGGLFFLFREDDRKNENLAVSDEPTVEVGGRIFSVEIADDPVSRSKGLSDRDELPEDRAMLFLFESPGRPGFWMKGMRFPIDIAWIRDGYIVHIARRVPADYPGTIHPDYVSDSVFETNAGALDSADVGSEVIFRGVGLD